MNKCNLLSSIYSKLVVSGDFGKWMCTVIIKYDRNPSQYYSVFRWIAYYRNESLQNHTGIK